MVSGFWQPHEIDNSAGIAPGFGATTLIINGGIECGGRMEHAASENRITYYTAFAEALGVDPGENLGCAGYNSFPAGGAGAVLTYWEKDWGKPGACKLVGYQTAYSVFKESDYQSCVEEMWGNQTDENISDNTVSSTQETTDSNTNTSQQTEDYESDCAIVTSWWPGDCGHTTSGKTCDRGWGTFDTITDCCAEIFPNSETCGTSILEESSLNLTSGQETQNDVTQQESLSETLPEAGSCYSLVAHISDQWCQTVACDQVYIDAGFCAIGD